MSSSLLSLITLIDIGDKYCMSFSAAVAARLVQLKFQVIYKKKCTKRFCLEYNSNECTCTITYYICNFFFSDELRKLTINDIPADTFWAQIDHFIFFFTL